MYGSLQNEANGGYGAIFRCAADGSDYKLLHAFTASDNDGASPVILAMDPDGTLYGISSRVNRTPLGLFRMKPDGSEFSLVYKPPPHIGAKDTAGVGLFTDGGDGSFYGVNSQAIFKIKKDGTGYTIVREFEGRDLQTGA